MFQCLFFRRTPGKVQREAKDLTSETTGRRLEQQVGAANGWGKRVERGSAEEARQAGARRTQGKAFNPAHQFDQQNVQRLPQFNFCRHFNHLLFPGGREGLKT